MSVASVWLQSSPVYLWPRVVRKPPTIWGTRPSRWCIDYETHCHFEANSNVGTSRWKQVPEEEEEEPEELPQLPEDEEA